MESLRGYPPGMIPLLIVLVVIVLLFGGGFLGSALHFLWIIAIIALVVWLVGFFVRSAGGGGRWYRW